MKFGLEDIIIDKIQQVFEANPKVDEALLFGSRAKGNYREDSDIDLALKGQRLSYDDILAIGVKLDELNLAYKIDLLNYHTIDEPALVEHIDRAGVVFYERWKEVELRNICKSITYGFTTSAVHEPVGPKFLRITDITSGKIDWEKVPYCKISEKDYKKYKLDIGDIVIARTGATTGFNAIIKEDVNAVYASYLIKFKIDNAKADPFYIGYVLQSDNFQNYVDSIAGGSAQPGANAQQFADFKFPIPPIPEQKIIASTLSSLDDKIDLLQRQNKTLEELAETLFKKWFIEDASEEWEVGRLGNVISVKGGTTPSSSIAEYWNGDVYWTTPRDLSNHESVFLFDTERKITEKGLAKIGSGLLPIGTVLLSSRAPIGYLAITNIPVAINQGYIAIICDKVLSNFFIYLWCKAHLDEIKNAGNGSVFQEISKTTFKELTIQIPSDNKLKEFEKIIVPIFNKIKTNQIQIASLTQTRDKLLPKLMSGELRIKI